jgi:hypothetical protein
MQLSRAVTLAVLQPVDIHLVRVSGQSTLHHYCTLLLPQEATGVEPDIITLASKNGALHAVKQRCAFKHVLSKCYADVPGAYIVWVKLPGGTWCAAYVGKSGNLKQRMRGYMHETEGGEQYFAPDKCTASGKFMCFLELLCKGAEVQIW